MTIKNKKIEENKPALAAWMKDRIDEIALAAAKHNHFKGIWEDVKWHRKTTEKIRK